MAEKTGTEPGGMVKRGPSLRSMIEAWVMKKVDICAKEMEREMVVAQMGRTRMKHLNSSTWVTVQSLHLLGVVRSWWSAIIAALSKNLVSCKGIPLVSSINFLFSIYFLKLVCFWCVHKSCLCNIGYMRKFLLVLRCVSQFPGTNNIRFLSLHLIELSLAHLNALHMILESCN